MGGKPKSANVLADYKSDSPVESSWNDEPLEAGWLKAFEEYLNRQKVGPASWQCVKGHASVRDMLELIHSLTSRDSPDRSPGSGFALEDKRELYSELKDRFGKVREHLSKIEELTTYRHPNVVDIHCDPIDWPPDRENFAKWIMVGQEMSSRLQKHFKSISHASREKRNDERFLAAIFVLRHKCQCKNSEVAALIGSGMAADGRIRNAEDFDQWKLKDDLRRLKRARPELYNGVEEGIKAQQAN